MQSSIEFPLYYDLDEILIIPQECSLSAHIQGCWEARIKAQNSGDHEAGQVIWSVFIGFLKKIWAGRYKRITEEQFVWSPLVLDKSNFDQSFIIISVFKGKCMSFALAYSPKGGLMLNTSKIFASLGKKKTHWPPVTIQAVCLGCHNFYLEFRTK